LKKTIATLFLLSLSAASFAQRTDKVTAWVNVQQTDGKVVISSWCQNNTPSPLHLSYKAVLIYKDSTVQEGKTLALPNQPNLLLNGNFLVDDGHFDKVILLVYKKDELVATAQAIGPKPEPPSQDLVRSPTSGRLSANDIEIEGLVIDETRSKLAHDFYELFYNSWSSVEEDIKLNYSITIREQPVRVGIGTRISVELDGEEFTQLNLQPRAEVLEALAIQLVESLYTHIMHPDQSYQEIEAEDISGSGIY
jgi:Curli assembly protein CsgE